MSIWVRKNLDGTYLVRCGSESVIIGARVPPPPPPPPPDPGGPLSPEPAGPFDPSRGSPLGQPRGGSTPPPRIWPGTTPSKSISTDIYLPGHGHRAPPGAIEITNADEIVAHLRQYYFSDGPFGEHMDFLVDPKVELKVEDLRNAARSGTRPLGSMSLYWKSHEQEL